MKILYTLLTCASILCNLPSFAQSKTESEEKPYIELNGRAEQEVIPNEIFISIVIRERYANKEKITIEAQEENLKTALKGLNIDLSNLSLSDVNADYVKVKFRTKDVLTKKDFTLKVTDAKMVGLVFQQLDKLEISDAYIPKVSHTKIDSLRKEVRIRAIKTAKDKADYLLAAIGEQAGKPLLITEVETPQALGHLAGVNVSSYQSTRMFGSYDKDKDSGGEQEIQFKKIKIECVIYVKFGIK